MLALAALLVPAGPAQSTSCEPGALARATGREAPTIESVLQDNREALRRLPPAVDTVLIGDSLTRRWPEALLKEALPTQVVFNYGMESDRTQNVLWRLEAPELQRIHPHRIVLMIGTNNLAAGDAPCAIAAGIAAIVAKVDQLWQHPQLRIIDIPPSGEDGQFRRAERLQVDAAIHMLLRRRGGGSQRNVDEALLCHRALPCHSYLLDRLHLSADGYKVLQSAVR